MTPTIAAIIAFTIILALIVLVVLPILAAPALARTIDAGDAARMQALR
jgi:hypothetical protein